MDAAKVRTMFSLRSKSVEDLEAWLSTRFDRTDRSTVILCASIAFYGILFSFLTTQRYYAFKTRAWDLGIFTQSLWTTLYANRFLYHTCELFINPSGSFFGVHFSPILFLILPLYRLATAPETLLVLQSFILAFAAVPIYKLAKEYAGGRTVGLVFAAAYLMYPSTQFVNWYDFHVQAFLPLFFAMTIYYTVKENWSKYFVFIFLSLMVEEHAAWITFAIGLYVAWKYRTQILSTLRKRLHSETKYLVIALATMIISVVWYWLTLWERNTFFPINPAALEDFLGAPNFSILGATDPLQIPILVIIRPWNAIQALAFDGYMKLLYLTLLFGPLAFFSFKAPSALIPTIPWFGFSLLSQAVEHHSLGHQYDAYVVSFIFVAGIFGLSKNFAKTHTIAGIRRSLKKIVAFNLMFFIIASPLCPVVNILFPSFTSISIGENELELNEVLSMIPANASILTQDNIFPQVSQRVKAYVVPDRFITGGSDAKVLALNFINETIDHVDFILLDSKTDLIAAQLVVSMLESKPQSNLVLLTARENGTIMLYWNPNSKDP